MNTPREYISAMVAANRAGKGQKARLIAAAAVEQLPYAEALEFVRLAKISQGAQDLDLLRDCRWTLRIGDVVERRSTEQLKRIIGGADVESYSIDWPSVSHHWGIVVRVKTTMGIVAQWVTDDYALTETYLSS